MARQPRRMTPEAFMRNIEPDPLSDAVFTDTLGIAGDLGDFLEQLKSFDVSSIKALLYRKPASGVGAFAYLGQVPAPINMDQVMEFLKDEYGGGEYRVTVFAGGKTRKQIEFPIYGASKPLKTPNSGGGGAANGELRTADLLTFMVQMQENARREAAEMRQAQAEQAREDRERDRDRQSAMWQAVAAIAPVALPLLMNREKLSEIVALMNAGKEDKSNLKDTVETIVLLKKAFGGDSNGADFNPEDIVGSLARMAGPVIGAAGRAFRNGGAQPHQEAENTSAEAAPLILPTMAREPQTLPPPASDVPPVLALIRPHVAYFYGAQLDPSLAADAIVDIMVRANVSDGDLNELVAAYTLSTDWKADLAASGLDLRGNPEWADDFLSELVAAWTERDRHGDGGDGRGGRMADAPDHEGPGAPGLPPDADKAARG